jgi:hypothetical protein
VRDESANGLERRICASGVATALIRAAAVGEAARVVGIALGDNKRAAAAGMKAAGGERSRMVRTTRSVRAARQDTLGSPGAVSLVGRSRKGLAAESRRSTSEAVQDGGALLGITVDIQPQVAFSVDLVL